MASTLKTNKLHNYFLPHDSEEQLRLSAQYEFVKKVLGLKYAVPAWLEVNSLSHVLDVAAGSLSWTFDLLVEPRITARVQAASNSLDIYACDITDAKFPRREIEAHGIKTFLQDVTKPFPDHFNDTFDFIHMSFVRMSLTEEGWRHALTNMNKILKPGGHLHIMETDNVFYSKEFPPPSEDSQHDIEASIRGTSWVHKLNSIYYSTTQANGFLPDLSYRFPSLLESGSFSVVSFKRNLTPFGKLCESYKGLDGSPLSDEMDFCTDNLRLVTAAHVKSLFGKGALEAPLGCKIENEEDCGRLMDDIVSGCREEGTCLILSEYVARKL